MFIWPFLSFFVLCFNFGFRPNFVDYDRTSLGTSPGSKAKKDKTLTKRRSSRKVCNPYRLVTHCNKELMCVCVCVFPPLFSTPKMDRESLSLSVSNSQFYTSPIPTASEHNSSIGQSDRDSGGGPLSLLSPTGATTTVSTATTPTNSLPVFELTEEVKKVTTPGVY